MLSLRVESDNPAIDQPTRLPNPRTQLLRQLRDRGELIEGVDNLARRAHEVPWKHLAEQPIEPISPSPLLVRGRQCAVDLTGLRNRMPPLVRPQVRSEGGHVRNRVAQHGR